MDDLLPVAEAAAELGTTPNVLIWLHRRELLPMEKRIGVRANLVSLEAARRALQAKRSRGRPPKTDERS